MFTMGSWIGALPAGRTGKDCRATMRILHAAVDTVVFFMQALTLFVVLGSRFRPGQEIVEAVTAGEKNAGDHAHGR